MTVATPDISEIVFTSSLMGFYLILVTIDIVKGKKRK